MSLCVYICIVILFYFILFHFVYIKTLCNICINSTYNDQHITLLKEQLYTHNSTENKRKKKKQEKNNISHSNISCFMLIESLIFVLVFNLFVVIFHCFKIFCGVSFLCMDMYVCMRVNSVLSRNNNTSTTQIQMRSFYLKVTKQTHKNNIKQ